MNLAPIMLVLGFFVSAAFIIVTITLRKRELGIGYWPLFAVSTLFLTAGEFSRTILLNDFGFEYFFFVAMIILSFAAFMKFWEIMRLIE